MEDRARTIVLREDKRSQRDCGRSVRFLEYQRAGIRILSGDKDAQGYEGVAGAMCLGRKTSWSFS